MKVAIGSLRLIDGDQLEGLVRRLHSLGSRLQPAQEKETDDVRAACGAGVRQLLVSHQASPH